MNKIAYMVMQGKGGCGKSEIAAAHANHLHISGGGQIIDTDPLNRTLSHYRALNVTGLDIMSEASIDPRKFDTLMQMLVEDPRHAVIDNGAACFLPLADYLTQSFAINYLADNGVQLVLVVPLIGSHDYHDTLNGLTSLAEAMPESRLIVWKNLHFGPVDFSPADTTFADRIVGIHTMHNRDSSTFGKDRARIRELGLTWTEAMAHPEFKGIAGYRLKMVTQELFAQMDTTHRKLAGDRAEEVAA
ncbi:hypothetical protein A9J41_12945 [Laribacter hongkongensis]|uniref:hypothetical protein n=1 Tax=Laribacter hongkongensis TaxID=168471 RepID=UPI001877D714|nr:hypothetical protein [Laribacter hongkongensis]MBE5528410.1 hypothetical protein [Laribacter hongkongensis]